MDTTDEKIERLRGAVDAVACAVAAVWAMQENWEGTEASFDMRVTNLLDRAVSSPNVTESRLAAFRDCAAMIKEFAKVGFAPEEWEARLKADELLKRKRRGD